MILKLEVIDSPAPKTNCSDLTGRKPKRKGATMVTFRRKRRGRKATRKNARSRRTVSRARIGSGSRQPRRNAWKRKVKSKKRRRRVKAKRGYMGTVHRPRLRKLSGKWYASRRKGSLIKRGTRINPKRRRRVSKRVRRNGIKGITRTMFNQKILMNTAKAGAGIAIGFSAMPFLYKVLPAGLKDKRRYLGGVHVALGLAIAGFVRNKDIKDVGMVIAATGVYDLIAMNVEFLGLPPLRTTSELADKVIPTRIAAPVTPAEAAAGCYGGNLQMTHYGASYPVGGAPVSPVAAAGVGASFERMGSSYPSLAYPTVGLSGDGGEDMNWEDLIN